MHLEHTVAAPLSEKLGFQLAPSPEELTARAADDRRAGGQLLREREVYTFASGTREFAVKALV
ncbi:hypothetical protein [Phyllobacterium bourgognense]|uniref:hypothetical protein n=1 Tax=Phyllobacterium bourgognense TaxID=314236 RepID=UPI0011C02A4E|nr:hypothetical protein [Phyllobacterium bourgognense]